MNHDKQINILIIDDLIENLKVLEQILLSNNYSVRKATKATIAIRAAKLSPPDIILLDVKMPQMDGFELCKRLKNDRLTAEIPIIFISALDETIDKVKAFNVGGVDYITKPFEVEEVLVRIKNQLTIHQQKQILQQEIQKRQQTEEILRQSRAFISGILNVSLDGIATVEAIRNINTGLIDDFRCIAVNSMMAKILNQDDMDLIGQTQIKKLTETINQDLFTKLINVVKTGKLWQQDIHYYNQNQQKRYWFNLTIVKLGDGCAITVRDITDRKKMEIELTQLNDNLQTCHHSLSHDLRHYLNHISMSSSLLKEELNENTIEDNLFLADTIYQASQKTNQILESIMQLAQIQNMEMLASKCNLSYFASQTIDFLQSVNPQRQVKVTIEDNVIIEAESKMLQVALENLLKNAWKFTQNVTNPQIEFGVITPDNGVWIEKIQLLSDNPSLLSNSAMIYFVKDNGVGFDMSKYQQLFQTFSRLHKSTEYVGSGLGLSITKQIIERHHGSIWAESELNQGTTIYFTLNN